MKRGNRLFVFSVIILLCAIVVSADEPGIFKKLWWKLSSPPPACGEEGLYSDAGKCGENCVSGECSGITVKGMKCYYCRDAKFDQGCDRGLYTDEGSCQHECDGECGSVWRAADRKCFYCKGKKLVPDPTATPVGPGVAARSCSEEGLFADRGVCDEHCAGGCSGVQWKGLECFYCGAKESELKQCDKGFFSSAASCNYACEGECNSVWRGSTLRCWYCSGILTGPVPPPPPSSVPKETPPVQAPKPAPLIPSGNGGAPGGQPPVDGGQPGVTTGGSAGGQQGGLPGGVTEGFPGGVQQDCPECEPILKELNIAEADLAKARKEANEQNAKVGALSDALDKADKALDDAKKALDNFENPKSWVEGEGRRLDSSDLQAIREANADAYARYKSGQMSAQQLQDYWGGLPLGEREKFKQKIRERLQKAVEDAQGAVDSAEQSLKDASAKLKGLQADVAELANDVEKLRESYEDCLKRCKKAGVSEGWGPWLRGFYDRLFGKDEEEESQLTCPPCPPCPAGDQITAKVITGLQVQERPKGCPPCPQCPRVEKPSQGIPVQTICDQKALKSDCDDCNPSDDCVPKMVKVGDAPAVTCYMCVFNPRYGKPVLPEEEKIEQPALGWGKPKSEVPTPVEQPKLPPSEKFGPEPSGVPTVCEQNKLASDCSACGAEEECTPLSKRFPLDPKNPQGDLGPAVTCYKCNPKGYGAACASFADGSFDSYDACMAACKGKDAECLGAVLGELVSPATAKLLNPKVAKKVCYQCRPGEEEEEDGGVSDGETPVPTDGPVTPPSDGPGTAPGPSDGPVPPGKAPDCAKGGMFNSEGECGKVCPGPDMYCGFMPSFMIKGAGCWQCVKEGYRDAQLLLCPKYGLQDYNACKASCNPNTGMCVGDYLSKSAKDLDKKWSQIRCYKCVPKPKPTGTVPKRPPSCDQLFHDKVTAAGGSIVSSCSSCKGNMDCKGPVSIDLPDPFKGQKVKCFVCLPKKKIVEKTQTGITIPTETQIPGPVPTEVDCTCPEGTSPNAPSQSGILAELQQHRCVSGASIKVQGTRKGNCPPCYSPPQIQINPTPPVCRGTPCGDVPCDGSAQCPCPDKPNCVLTVRCTWGGWKSAGQNQFVPVLGAG